MKKFASVSHKMCLCRLKFAHCACHRQKSSSTPLTTITGEWGCDEAQTIFDTHCDIHFELQGNSIARLYQSTSTCQKLALPFPLLPIFYTISLSKWLEPKALTRIAWEFRRSSRMSDLPRTWFPAGLSGPVRSRCSPLKGDRVWGPL